MTASPAEQIRFNLTFESLWYWYGESSALERQLSACEKVNGYYAEVTGIQAQSEEMIRTAYEMKQSVCVECVPALERTKVDLTKYMGRAKRRGWTLVIAVPAALAIGFGVGSVVN